MKHQSLSHLSHVWRLYCTDDKGKLSIGLNERRDDFLFFQIYLLICRFLDFYPLLPAYGAYVFQVIRYQSACLHVIKFQSDAGYIQRI